MTKFIEELSESTADLEMRIGRLSMDILGAIPVAPVKVRAWVERPGSRISLMAAEMVAARNGGTDRAVASVSAWLLGTSDTADVATDGFAPLIEGEADPEPHSWEGDPGYLETISWRRQRDARQSALRGVAEPAGISGRRRGDDTDCNGWRLSSIARTV